MDRIYSAYGTHVPSGHAQSAYAGERTEADTGWYLLGERPYSPLLRRFLARDTLSPFDIGGFHRYAYCGGDPVNRVDPSGHVFGDWFSRRFNTTGMPRSRLARTEASSAAGTPSTPDMASTTVAARMDTTTVSSGIAARSTATSGGPGDAVWGQLASTSNAQRDAAMPPPAKRPRTSDSRPDIPENQRREGGPSVPVGTAPLARSLEMPDPPTDIARQGNPAPTWTSRRPHRNLRSRIYTVGTELTTPDIYDELIGHLTRRKIRHVNLYSGARGFPDGNNWDARTRHPRVGDSEYIRFDQAYVVPIFRHAGIRVTVVDMRRLTPDSMSERLKLQGNHVVNCCYGEVDEAVVKALMVTPGGLVETPAAP